MTYYFSTTDNKAVHEITRLFIESLLKKLKKEEVPDTYADLSERKLEVFQDQCTRRDMNIGVYGFLDTAKGPISASANYNITNLTSWSEEHLTEIEKTAIESIKLFWDRRLLPAKAINECFKGLM